MTVDRREVRRIADLARLGIDSDEVDRVTDEMNRILEHANRLRGLVGEPEAARVTNRPHDDGERSGSGTRDVDAERPDSLSEGIASFAPQQVDGFFVVPPPPGVGGDRRRGESEVGP